MPFPESVPELTDGVVHLRAHRATDAPRIIEQSTDPQSLRWTTVPSPYGPEQAREFLGRIATDWDTPGGNRSWAVCVAGDPGRDFQGTIDLRPRGGGLAAVGYGLHPDGRGRHLMSGALRLVADYWFAHAGGSRLTWTAFGGNLASWAVARAAGFGFDAVVPGCATTREDQLSDQWWGSRDAGTAAEPRTPWFRSPPAPAAKPADATRARLRAWRDDDHAAIEEPQQPPHWTPARGVPGPETFAAWLARRRLNEARGICVGWCLADPPTDRAVGDVVLFRQEGTLAPGQEAELGYWVSPSARGRSIAQAGARAAATWAFAADGLGARRLTAVTAWDNHPSNAVLGRVGFARWGQDPRAAAPDGSIGAAYYWSLERPSSHRDTIPAG